MNEKSVLFITAHADDAEQFGGGTSLILKKEGFSSTFAVVTDGGCGGSQARDEVVAIREQESLEAAAFFEAKYTNLGLRDGEVANSIENIRRIAVVIQETRPSLIFTHPIEDATPDHRNVGQMVRHAAILSRLKNADLPTNAPSLTHDFFIYHTDPQGLRDTTGQYTPVNTIVDISDVIEPKLEGFALHKSQMGPSLRPVHKTRLWGQIRGLQANVQYAEGFNQLYDPEWYLRENKLASILGLRRVFCL